MATSVRPFRQARPNVSETITATSLDHGAPVTGVPVRYTVGGANPGGGSSVTGPDGAPIALTGAHAGTDVVAAFVDVDGDGVYDSDSETQSQVQITWTAPPSAPASPVPALSSKASRNIARASPDRARGARRPPTPWPLDGLAVEDPGARE